MRRDDPTLCEPDDTDSLDGWERALLERQLEALDRLAEMGMALAAAISGRATAEAPAPDADLGHAAVGFARVSRAVRMTFALQSRLIAEFKGASEARSTRAGKARSGWGAGDDWDVGFGVRPDVVDHDEVLKRQLTGVVQELAEAEAMDGEAVRRLVLEAGERLEDDHFFRGLTKRPMGEIVALVCKDLGIQPDWDLLSDIYWAKAEIENSPPGSPYAGWQPRQAALRDGLQAAPSLVPSG